MRLLVGRTGRSGVAWLGGGPAQREAREHHGQRHQQLQQCGQAVNVRDDHLKGQIQDLGCVTDTSETSDSRPKTKDCVAITSTPSRRTATTPDCVTSSFQPRRKASAAMSFGLVECSSAGSADLCSPSPSHLEAFGQMLQDPRARKAADAKREVVIRRENRIEPLHLSTTE